MVGKLGNMISERLNSVGKQEISIGNVGNRILIVVVEVRKTLYLSYENVLFVFENAANQT